MKQMKITLMRRSINGTGMTSYHLLEKKGGGDPATQLKGRGLTVLLGVGRDTDPAKGKG